MFNVFSNIFQNGFPGMPSFIGESRENINAAGVVRIDNTTVSEQTIISGILNCQNSFLNSLQVTGTTNISHTTINTGVFVGLLVAKNCIFNDNMRVTSNEVNMKTCSLKDVVVSDQNPSVDQLVLLSGDTVVEGNINFISGRGKVILEDNAVVNGQVIGGNIERRSNFRFGFF